MRPHVKPVLIIDGGDVFSVERFGGIPQARSLSPRAVAGGQQLRMRMIVSIRSRARVEALASAELSRQALSSESLSQ